MQAEEGTGEKVIINDEGKFELIVPEGAEGTAQDADEFLQKSQEPTERAVVVSMKADTVTVRMGMGLMTNTSTGSLVRFTGGQIGILLAWKESLAIIQVPSGTVQLGEEAQTTGIAMTTAASSSLFGRILNPRGEPLDGRPAPPVPPTKRQTFQEYKGLQERSNLYRPLHTGILGVDFSVPVGRGQTMLFQGTNVASDIHHLWPDLMAVNVGPKSECTQAACICVCANLEAAEKMRAQLEEKGCWDRCVLIVPDTEEYGAGMVAMTAAVAFAEEISDTGAEAMALMEFEPMTHVWRWLADAAGEERKQKGIIVDPKDSTWVHLEGTVLTESISERRKFWFALISRAANSAESGSVSLLGWLWEQSGGLDRRKQRSYELKLQQIKKIPRIDEYVRMKMIDKVEKEAAAEGIVVNADAPMTLDDDGIEREVELAQGPVSEEPTESMPGVPNWEIEELKSITDGHILLQPPAKEDAWSWIVDPYKSLPRLGTDAMHPALLSMDAHKLRLKMLQGRDRANLLHDTLGSPDMLDTKERLELRYIELILEQPAGAPLKVEDQVARLAIACNEKCRALDGAGCTPENLNKLAAQLLDSEVGQRAIKSIAELGEVREEEKADLVAAVQEWNP